MSTYNPRRQLSPGRADVGKGISTVRYVLSGGFHCNSSTPASMSPNDGEVRCQKYANSVGSKRSLRVSSAWASNGSALLGTQVVGDLGCDCDAALGDWSGHGRWPQEGQVPVHGAAMMVNNKMSVAFIPKFVVDHVAPIRATAVPSCINPIVARGSSVQQLVARHHSMYAYRGNVLRVYGMSEAGQPAPARYSRPSLRPVFPTSLTFLVETRQAGIDPFRWMHF